MALALAASASLSAEVDSVPCNAARSTWHDEPLTWSKKRRELVGEGRQRPNLTKERSESDGGQCPGFADVQREL